MICKQCGREVPDQVNFCRYCGVQLVPIVAPIPEPTPEPVPEPIPVPNAKKSRRWLIPVIAGGAALCVAMILLLSWLLPGKAPEEPVAEEPPVSDVPQDEPVTEPEEEIPPVYEVSIEGKDEVTAGKSVTLSAVVTPDAVIERIVWTSSNETIATIKDGVVSGVSEGDVTIRVLLLTEDNQVLEAELPFTVLPVPVTYNAVMEPEEMNLRAGSADDFKITVTSEPEQEEIEYAVTWESADPKIAAVTDGRVQAVGEGDVTITARVSLPGGKLIVLQGNVTVTAAAAATPPAVSGSTSTQKPSTPQKPTTTPQQPAKPQTPAPQQPTTPQTPAPQQPAAPNLTLKDEALVATEDYLISNSNSAYISISSLEALNETELIYARNEIYARHGRRFDTGWIQEYFNGKSWYEGTVAPAQFDPAVFNEYELENLLRIQYVERNR